MSDNLFRSERFPTPWCPGCGLNSMLLQAASVLKKNGYDKSNTAVVSGIGCAARASGFFDLDGINGLHGRAIPLAEGLKLANPGLKVVVFSGDGDLIGIGGNHLLHCARRNTELIVICSANEIYGMTGGQMSPLTKKGTKTMTSPKGAPYEPLDVQALLMSNKHYFYARTSVAFLVHMVQCMEAALKHNGFAFVEVINPCFTNFGSKIGFNSLVDMLQNVKTTYKIVENSKRLGNLEMGIVKND